MTTQFNISTIISAVDRISAPIRNIQRSFAGLQASVRSASGAVDSAMNRTGRTAQTVGSRISQAFNSINFRRLQFQLRNVQSQFNRVGRSARDIGTKVITAGIVGTVAQVAAMRSISQAGSSKQDSITALTQGYIPDVKRKNPNMSDDDALKQARNMALQKDAELVKRGPASNFAVAELRAGVARLKSAAIDPTNQLITAFENFKALKPALTFEQVSEAIIDLKTGETERAKEAFGMKFAKTKGKDEYTHTDAFGKTKTLTTAELPSYIAQYGTENALYKDAGKRQGESNSVAWSGVGDAFTALKERMAGQTELGEVDPNGYMAKETNLAKQLSDALKDVTAPMSQFSKLWGELLEKFGGKLISGMTKVVKTVGAFATAFPNVTKALMIAAPVLTVIGAAVLALGFAISTIGAAIGGIGIALGFLISAPVLIVAAAAAAVALIYVYRDEINSFFTSAWEGVKASFTALCSWVVSKGSMLYNAGAAVITSFLEGLQSIWGGVEAWFGEKIAWLANIASTIGSSISGAFSGSTTVATNVYNQSSVNKTGAFTPLANKPAIVSPLGGNTINNTNPVNVSVVNHAAGNTRVVTKTGASINKVNTTGKSARLNSK